MKKLYRGSYHVYFVSDNTDERELMFDADYYVREDQMNYKVKSVADVDVNLSSVQEITSLSSVPTSLHGYNIYGVDDMNIAAFFTAKPQIDHEYKLFLELKKKFEK
jgi:hypothetical protein